MSSAASQVLAKGPLSSALGQWAFVGLGAYALAGGEALKDAAGRTASVAAQLAAGLPLSAILDASNLNNSRSNHNAGATAAMPAPIVIHHTSPASGSGRLLTERPLIFLVQLTLGAGLCWGSYIVLSNLLPEQIKEMLPVTRKFFDAAITSLGKGLLQVKEQLGEQILGLSTKQDELSQQQSETHTEVLSVKNDLGEVRFDLGAISDTVERCEASLAHADRRQSYTAKGVRLLVRCVGAMMPGNARLAGELDRFAQQGDEMGIQDIDEGTGAAQGGVALPAIEQGGGSSYPALPQCTPGTDRQTSHSSGSTPMMSHRSRSAGVGDNPQVGRTPSYVTPNVARALNSNNDVSSVESDPECAGHEPVSTPMTMTGGGTGGNGKTPLPPPTPQDLDEVRLLLDMVRRGGTLSVN